jgi:SH3-like domain-containing protein
MKKFYQTAVVTLLVLKSIMVAAQPVSYNTLLQELQTLQKQLVPDKRVAILEITFKDTLQPVVVVQGETDLPEAKNQVLGFLKERNVQFIDSVRVLPDAAVGEKTWALGTLSVSNLRAKPDDASELVSQVLMGTPLKVLDAGNKWYRVQTPEKYIGWMDAAGLQRLTTEEFNPWKKSERAVFNNLFGLSFETPDENGDVVSDLTLGDLFEVTGKKGGFLKIRIPDGREAFVKKTDCLPYNEWINIIPDAKSLLKTARKMKGIPYLWGGTSGKGADCSGFTKTVFYSEGVILARDASQQAKYGQPLEISDWRNFQPGDLLFFGRSAEKVTHVGIYTGDSYFIHASGKVHISSLDPKDPKFVPERKLVAARRILGSTRTEGIVNVKDHPWYN